MLSQPPECVAKAASALAGKEEWREKESKFVFLKAGIDKHQHFISAQFSPFWKHR